MIGERYDQIPGEDYGHCLDCEETFATRGEMHEHLSATAAVAPLGVGSHRGRTTNPTRAERIRNRLGHLAEDALSRFLEDIDRVTRDGVTEEEITEALKFVDIDVSDGWADYLQENE